MAIDYSQQGSFEENEARKAHRRQLTEASSGNKTPERRAAMARLANMTYKATLAGKLQDPATAHALLLAKDAAALRNATAVQTAVLGGKESSGLVSDDTLGYEAPGAQQYESFADRKAKLDSLRGGIAGYGGSSVAEAGAGLRALQDQAPQMPTTTGPAAPTLTLDSLRGDPNNFIKWGV